MRTPRDFASRPLDEQRWMVENTWCDKCQEVDLGMNDPIEYEEDDSIFVEGKCKKCGATVVNEVNTRDE